MYRIYDALCRLLAPVLAFTSEEAWRYLDGNGSIHLQLFPEMRASQGDTYVNDALDRLLKLRAVISQALEKARQQKLIGNSLEARVILRCERKFVEAISKDELEEFFIIGDLVLEEADELSAVVERSSFAKCARCWRHRETVGKSHAHPDLCDRCEDVIQARLSSA